VSEAKQAARQVLAGDPGPTARRWLAWVAAVTAALFVIDSYQVVSGRALVWDRPLEQLVQRIDWGPIASVMTLTNWIRGWRQTVLGAVVVGLLMLWDRRAGLLMLVGSGASLLDQFLKISIGRHRPTANLVQVLQPETGYSYPSGHAVFYTWLAFMLAVLIAPRLLPSHRVLLWAGASILILVACLGRVWAGDHWPSDAAGGFLLALSWSTIVLWLPERYFPQPRIRARE
jgi:undecaprenyl-diphosphatase